MKRVPLPRTFMLSSMLGFLIVTVYTFYGRLDLKWGVAFGFVFALMFIASVLSITPPDLDKSDEPEDEDSEAIPEPAIRSMLKGKPVVKSINSRKRQKPSSKPKKAKPRPKPSRAKRRR